MELFLEVIGWFGAAAIVAAYFMNSFGLIQPKKLYQTLNLFGAFGVVANSAYHQALPPAALNTVWFFIALSSLFRLARTSSRRAQG